LQNYFPRFCVGPALLPPRSAFERSAATPEALQNGKITQAADKSMTKMQFCNWQHEKTSM